MERPILFPGPMVRAILGGRKTMTRRVVKQSESALLDFLSGDTDCMPGNSENLGQRIETGGMRVWCSEYPEEGSELIKCPYGVSGDRLWVKETFSLLDGDYHPIARPWGHDPAYCHVVYKADHRTGNDGPEKVYWQSSMFMKREYSRLSLEITNIRVEKLQEITEEDASAEGIEKSDNERLRSWPYLGANHPVKGTPKVFPAARQAFESIWDSINGKTYPWSSNPWVWVVEFKLKARRGDEQEKIYI